MQVVRASNIDSLVRHFDVGPLLSRRRMLFIARRDGCGRPGPVKIVWVFVDDDEPTCNSTFCFRYRGRRDAGAAS